MRKIQLVKNEEMMLEELKEQYLRRCKIRNLSEYTITYYQNCCSSFLKCFDEEIILVHQIDRRMVEEYILILRDRGIKNSTIQTYLRGLKAIVNYGIDLGYIQRFKIELPKATFEIKSIYTDEEIMNLLEKPDMRNFSEYRNYVIINFLLATGVRSIELLNVSIADIDVVQEMITLRRTKNGKHRFIPISRSLKALLYEYMEYRGSSEATQYLFCNEFGRQLKRSSIQHGITKYCSKRGVQKHSIHLFRHTFATKWILNGGDPFQLQRILGHSSMKMVNRYINMTGEDLKIRFNECNPLEQLQTNKKEHISMKGKKKG